MISMQQIKFCAEECERQQSGEMSVYRMVAAYDYATGPWARPIVTVEFIQKLGLIVDQRNQGFRRTPVIVGGNTLSWENIPHQILALTCAALTPAEFYQEFEEIHPFIDGNGRVGAILFNLLSGTMDYPQVPPEFKKRGGVSS